jgi:TatD DNase family protein
VNGSLIDTHVHLDDPQFEDCRDDVVQRAVQAGLSAIISVGTTADSSEQTVALARQYRSVFAAVGIQPNYVAETQADDWSRIEKLVGQEKVVALGETGLDKYWDYSPLPQQQDYFQRHLSLSQKTGLPFIVHMRDCQSEILQMLRDARRSGPLQGVMHSYTGDAEGAAECIDLGMYISFAGMVTFKKSLELRAIAQTIPDDRILIETDAPYLSPHPHRSIRPNEPALIVHTAHCLAEARDLSFERFAQQTTANATRLFGLP